MGIILIIFVVLAILSCLFLKKFKKMPSTGTITLCTGAVKTGKSTLAVYLALRDYRRRLFQFYLRKYLFFDNKTEKPLLYSNIPLKCSYVPITTDILLRRERINYKSVVLLDEASLVADSQLIKDQTINKSLLKFFKLFGHFSHGGSLIIDTQSISDLHYAIKRCINSYIYIHSTFKYIPFFVLMKIIENRYSDDGSVIVTENTDISDRLKSVLVPKSIWKKFDTYTYSVLTDNLKSNCSVVNNRSGSLKSDNIPSFRDWSD